MKVVRAFVHELRSRLVPMLPVVVAAACSPYLRATDSSKTQEEAVHARVLAEALDSVAHPCLKHSPPAPEDQGISPAQVFVESVLVEIPIEAHLASGADALSSVTLIPGARFVSSPHVIARLDTPTTVKIERILVPGASPEPGIFWTSTTILPKLAAANIILEVDIEVQTTEQKKDMPANEVHEGVHLRNVFAAHARQTVVLNAPVPGHAKGTLLIALTPYLIQNQRDLRDIFECKVQQRAALGHQPK